MGRKKQDLPTRFITQLIILVYRVVKAVFAPSPKARAAAAADKRAANPPRTVVSAETFVWPATEDYEFEIVGEASYQPELARLAGDHGNRAAWVEFRAALLPEVHPADDFAVRVQALSGSTIGYLSREDAQRFRRRLSAKRIGGQATVCNAVVTGGGKSRDGKEFKYGVRLALKPFE